VLSIQIFFAFTGTIIAFIRFSEPFVYHQFLSDVYNLRRRLCARSKASKLKPDKFAVQPLCAFTNSAMNIEFVYLILLGINSFMEHQLMLKNFPNQDNKQMKKKNKDSSIIIEKKNGFTRITLCELKLKDIELWNVDQMNIQEKSVSDFFVM
jgi:heme exporter protein D